MKTVEIIISPDGSNVEVEASGFQGSGCLDSLRGLLNEFEFDERLRLKPEYNAKNASQIKIGGR